MQYTQHITGNIAVLLNQDVLPQYDSALFERTAEPTDLSRAADIKDSQDADNGNTEGRGTVVFFEHAGHELVLKRYHRGGLLGKLIRSTYLFSGAERSRMWREFMLLGQMRDLGLPVPRPVASRCVKTSPVSCTGELITERIRDARTLADLLCERALPERLWENMGRMIRRFHDHSIDHTDLNASNIMLTSASDIYLIDFDKCLIRTGRNSSWQQRNLDRLLRSLHKWKAREASFHFNDTDWQALQRGYHQPNCNTPSSSAASLSSLRSLP